MKLLTLKHFKNIGLWIKQRWFKIPERDSPNTVGFLLSFLIITTFLAIIAALGAPLGPSVFMQILNIGLFVLGNALLLSAWLLVVSLLLSFTYLPLARIFLAGFTYTITATATVFHIANSGLTFSIIIGVLTGTIALTLGLLIVLFFKLNISRIIKMTGLIGIVIITTILFIPKSPVNVPAFSEQTNNDNPAQLGNYEPTFFTYGSGDDLHRKEFGENIDYETPTLDASDFITRWSDKRAKFWGFTQETLPINGRAWVPEGEGPFPVMLIAHGNHTMEYFSTAGYDYLGELLASRGFIMISVDQDFINYSGKLGSPNRNYELRTWVMLQHIVQLQEMNNTPSNFLSGKIDFENVAYAGHSRGGQAALMAADYKSFFPDDESLNSLEDINVKGVIAISPTDKLVDSKRAKIHNTSYLLLHGARDSDVSAFRDAGFNRVTFDPEDDGFRTSLYIADANHTHFNTDWGSMDTSLPRGIFLNQQDILAPEEQQQIAKVYVSAFLERIFNKDLTYDELFQDYRYALDWLPNTTYVNNYKAASYKQVQSYHPKDFDHLILDGFTKQKIHQPTDRDGNKRKRHALELKWHEAATYTLDMTHEDLSNTNKLIFTMANIDADNTQTPNIQLEIETTNGETHILPFNDYMPFPAVIKTKFTKFGLFENSFRDVKYENAWEPIYQTFEIPIDSVKWDEVKNIRLQFSGNPGNILIEEIGLE